MSLEKIRETAEKHWKYTSVIIEKTHYVKWVLELCHYLYVEAFVHGYKHRLEEEGLTK